MHWIVTLTRHHNVDQAPEYVNIEAEDRDTAILKAYEQVIMNLRWDLDFDFEYELLGPILNSKDFCVELRDCNIVLGEEPEKVTFFLWNEGPDNRGVGVGESIDETDKYENIWFSLEERSDNNLDLVMRGYQRRFKNLSLEMQKAVVTMLDKTNE